MKSVIASVFLAALAGLANAKVILTNTNYDDIQVGKAFEITWADAEGPVTILLKNGAENDLKDVSTITSGQTSGSFSWTPSSDLSGNYAFEITDGVDVNYSQMFTLNGTPSTTTTAASSASSTGSSTSTSYPSSTQEASSTLSTITKSSSTSSATSSATSASSGSPSSSGSASPATSSGAASSSSPATTTSASSTSSTHSSSATSASATASQTVAPNNNDARGLVAPLFAPILVAVGAAFL
ncbi:Ser-Thr-rich glycosyl-phosphatidyl-inositol-anchored membrane family-domain-containing protein [Biscogniauxia sp. FL1348]|nr:Ser-Thr-rich glycosyl-phosphatidyl-inositol-anchored membrane family-domain-containing protein [Biscogniauxia sp. FL1348]